LGDREFFTEYLVIYLQLIPLDSLLLETRYDSHVLNLLIVSLFQLINQSIIGLFHFIFQPKIVLAFFFQVVDLVIEFEYLFIEIDNLGVFLLEPNLIFLFLYFQVF
jgi:hypothetical protein